MTLPFYPFYWGDYSKKTFNLTQSQHGAYILLLRHIYCEGEKIPDEQRYSIAKAMDKVQMQNTDFVLKTYFQKKAGMWSQSKADEVMADADEKHQNRVIAGQSPKKTRKQSKSNASAKLKQNPNNHNQNHNHNPERMKTMKKKQNSYGECR